MARKLNGMCYELYTIYVCVVYTIDVGVVYTIDVGVVYTILIWVHVVYLL